MFKRGLDPHKKAKDTPGEAKGLSIDLMILLFPALISIMVLCVWSVFTFVTLSHEAGRKRAEVAVDGYIDTARFSYESGGAVALANFLDQISSTTNSSQAVGDNVPRALILFRRQNGTIVFRNFEVGPADRASLDRMTSFSISDDSAITPETKKSELRVVGKRVVIADRFDVFIGQTYVPPTVLVSKQAVLVISGLAILVLLVALGFIWSQRQYTRRISMLTNTLKRVAAGEQGIRVPLAQSRFGNWEIDNLSIRMNATLDRIESTTGAIRDWTAQAAHELRSHLALVAEKVETLGEPKHLGKKSENDGQQSALMAIRETLDVFDALLNLVEIRTDVDQYVGPLDIETVFEKVRELYGFVAEEIGVTFNFVNTGPRLLGEHWLITRAILDLVDNALKFAPPKSVIDIGWMALPDGAILTVRDRGIGTLGASLRQMMSLPKTSKDDMGHRIGLRTAEAIAIRHGAKLLVSDANPGLCAQIKFPIERLIEPNGIIMSKS
jgi:signal transduction histidine kinase